MAVLNFLNENEFRDYPFQHPCALPDGALVEAVVVTGPESGFDPAVHSVWLAACTPTALTFRSDAPGLAGNDLVVPVPVAPAEFTVCSGAEAEPPTGSSSSLAVPACNFAPLWEATVVVGDATALPTAAFAPTDCVLEPARVVPLGEYAVASVNLANGDRVRADAPDGCPTPAPDLPGDPPFVAARCIDGDLKFRPGYNAVIAVDRPRNAIVFSAAVGAGAGQPCAEVPAFPGELPPPGSPFLSGGPACSGVVSGINGVPGPVVGVQTGAGVAVTADPGLHTLTVDFTMAGFLACPPGSSSSFPIGGGGGGSPLATNLLAFWRMNELSGNRTDSSGNGMTLTETSTVGWTPGIIGRAALFFSSPVAFLTRSTIITAAPFTFAGFFRVDTISGAPLMMQALTFPIVHLDQALRASSDGTLSAVAQNGSGGAVGGAWTVGEWFHAAMTSDGAITRLYVNGVAVAAASETPSFNPNPFSVMGYGSVGHYSSTDGAADLVGVWGRELTPTEVAELYNGGAGFDPTA